MRFRLSPTAPAPTSAGFPPPGAEDDALAFFAVLDFVLRTNGHPAGEDALVHRYRAIGVGGGPGFAETSR